MFSLAVPSTSVCHSSWMSMPASWHLAIQLTLLSTYWLLDGSTANSASSKRSTGMSSLNVVSGSAFLLSPPAFLLRSPLNTAVKMIIKQIYNTEQSNQVYNKLVKFHSFMKPITMLWDSRILFNLFPLNTCRLSYNSLSKTQNLRLSGLPAPNFFSKAFTHLPCHQLIMSIHWQSGNDWGECLDLRCLGPHTSVMNYFWLHSRWNFLALGRCRVQLSSDQLV